MTPRVLLVDDEPNVTKSLRRALIDEPYEVMTASSGPEALDILSRSPADIVVSDERMPEMAGVDLLCQVKSRYPETIRILLTGQASADAALRAITDARVYRFLRKPCHPDEFVATLSAALATRAELRIGPTTIDDGARLDGYIARAQLAFQPIVDATDGSIRAYEALLRTTDGNPVTPSPVNPGIVLALAGALGRTQEVDRKVSELAATILAAGALTVPLYLNVHPGLLLGTWLIDAGNPLLRHAGRVVLEVSERAPLREIGLTREHLAPVRAAGYRFAVDDLGLGSPGLLSFAMLQPDILKLDIDVIRRIHADPARSKHVESMVWLSRELGLGLICEGVETADEASHLRDLGAALMQGYHFGRPGPLVALSR